VYLYYLLFVIYFYNFFVVSFFSSFFVLYLVFGVVFIQDFGIGCLAVVNPFSPKEFSQIDDHSNLLERQKNERRSFMGKKNFKRILLRQVFLEITKRIDFFPSGQLLFQ